VLWGCIVISELLGMFSPMRAIVSVWTVTNAISAALVVRGASLSRWTTSTYSGSHGSSMQIHTIAARRSQRWSTTSSQNGRR